MINWWQIDNYIQERELTLLRTELFKNYKIKKNVIEIFVVASRVINEKSIHDNFQNTTFIKSFKINQFQTQSLKKQRFWTYRSDDRWK